MNLKNLIGSGDKIGLFSLPIVVIGLIMNFLMPSFFGVGGPAKELFIVSIIVLIPGVVIWIWCIILIATKVSNHQLITGGPYAVVKHPLYTNAALLVLPWIGFIFNSWLGVVIGIVVYSGSRIYSTEEEKHLSKIFGKAWEDYTRKVMLPWL